MNILIFPIPPSHKSFVLNLLIIIFYIRMRYAFSGRRKKAGHARLLRCAIEKRLKDLNTFALANTKSVQGTSVSVCLLMQKKEQVSVLFGLSRQVFCAKKNTHDTRNRVLSKKIFLICFGHEVCFLKKVYLGCLFFFLAGRACAGYGKCLFQSRPRMMWSI